MRLLAVFGGRVDERLDDLGVSRAVLPVRTTAGVIGVGVPASGAASRGLAASKPPVSSLSLGWHLALSNTHRAHLLGPDLKEKQGRSGVRAR